MHTYAHKTGYIVATTSQQKQVFQAEIFGKEMEFTLSPDIIFKYYKPVWWTFQKEHEVW